MGTLMRGDPHFIHHHTHTRPDPPPSPPLPAPSAATTVTKALTMTTTTTTSDPTHTSPPQKHNDHHYRSILRGPPDCSL